MALAALRNFGLQLISVGVDEGFKLDAHYWITYPPDFYLRNMALRAHLCSEKAKTCPARLPLQAIHVWYYITTALAALYLIAWTYLSFKRPEARADSDRRLFMAFGAVLIFGRGGERGRVRRDFPARLRAIRRVWRGCCRRW